MWLANLCRAVIILFFLTISTLSYGQESRCLSGNTTTIYFGNGINTTPIQAWSTITTLKVAYRSSLETEFPGQNFEFMMSYNYTSSIFVDLLEVFQQKLDEKDTNPTNLTAAQILSFIQVAEPIEVEDPFFDVFKDALLDQLIIGYYRISNTEHSALRAGFSTTVP